MPVVVCSSCNARINVKDEMLGKKAKCPKCATLIELEAADDAPSTEVAAKRERRPVPPPVEEEEDNPFAITDDPSPRSRKVSPEPVFEPVEDDENEKPEEEAPRRGGRRRDEENEDELPRPKKRRGRNSDDKDDDPDISRGGRSGDKWSTVRWGLRTVFYATLVVITLFVILQITFIVSATVVGAGIDDVRVNLALPGQLPKNVPPPRQVGAGAAVFSLLVMGLGLCLLAAGITNLVGQMACCFGPPGTAQRRARISMCALLTIVYALLATVVVGIHGGGNQPDQGAAGGMGMGILFVMGTRTSGLFMSVGGGALAVLAVTLITLMLTYLIFWVLFHSAVAGHFKDKALQSRFTKYLIAVLVVPFLSGGLNFGLAMALMPVSFVAHAAVSGTLNILINGAMMGWYLVLNRKLVALIDDNT